MKRSPMRIALYSHDTQGFGHTRRNLLIARALTESYPGSSVLLITGMRESSTFETPRGVDFLTLPALRKGLDGSYDSRHLNMSLDAVVALRSAAIAAALEAYDPSVLIVDKAPRGVLGELDAGLRAMRRRGRVCVLGLRDVLDHPTTVDREWKRGGYDAVIEEHYRAVWIYGDPRVYETVREYSFGLPVSSRASYTGYLDPSTEAHGPVDPADPLESMQLPPGRLVLCQLGGGQDGTKVAEAFLSAPVAADTNRLLLTGPFMSAADREWLHSRSLGLPRVRVVEFVSNPAPLLRRADRVISMGGYNTVLETLSASKPTLVVPRTQPRQEQLIRAERLRDLGLIDLLLPDQLSSASLGGWLSREVPAPDARSRIDMEGLTRVPKLLASLFPSGFEAPPAAADASDPSIRAA